MRSSSGKGGGKGGGKGASADHAESRPEKKRRVDILRLRNRLYQSMKEAAETFNKKATEVKEMVVATKQSIGGLAPEQEALETLQGGA